MGISKEPLTPRSPAADAGDADDKVVFEAYSKVLFEEDQQTVDSEPPSPHEGSALLKPADDFGEPPFGTFGVLNWLAVVSFIRGMRMTLPVCALTRFVEHDLRASPEEAASLFSQFGVAVFLPMCLTPLWGVLVDVFPLAAGQYRSPYIVLSMFATGALFMGMCFCRSVPALIWVVLPANICASIYTCTLQAWVADMSEALDVEESNWLWCIVWRWYGVGRILGGILAAISYALFSNEFTFIATGAAHVLAAVFLVSMGRVEYVMSSDTESVLPLWTRTATAGCCNKYIAFAFLVVFLIYCAPTTATTMTGTGYSYLTATAGLHVPRDALGNIQLVGALGWLIGAQLYSALFSNVRDALKILLPCSALLQLAGIPLFSGVTKGHDDVYSLVYVGVWYLLVATVLAAWNIPIYVYLSKMSLPFATATVMSLYSSVMNFALILSNQTSVQFQTAFGITAQDYSSMYKVVAVCGLCQVVLYTACLLIPQEIEEDAKEMLVVLDEALGKGRKPTWIRYMPTPRLTPQSASWSMPRSLSNSSLASSLTPRLPSHLDLHG